MNNSITTYLTENTYIQPNQTFRWHIIDLKYTNEMYKSKLSQNIVNVKKKPIFLRYIKRPNQYNAKIKQENATNNDININPLITHHHFSLSSSPDRRKKYRLPQLNTIHNRSQMHQLFSRYQNMDDSYQNISKMIDKKLHINISKQGNVLKRTSLHRDDIKPFQITLGKGLESNSKNQFKDQEMTNTYNMSNPSIQYQNSQELELPLNAANKGLNPIILKKSPSSFIIPKDNQNLQKTSFSKNNTVFQQKRTYMQTSQEYKKSTNSVNFHNNANNSLTLDFRFRKKKSDDIPNLSGNKFLATNLSFSIANSDDDLERYLERSGQWDQNEISQQIIVKIR